MPLSEYEQRVLDELERDLGADPKLKKSMARAPRSSARIAIALIAVIGGLAVLVGGAVAQQPVVGIAGFIVMLGTVVWALFAPQGRGHRAAKGADGKAGKGPANSSGKSARHGLMARLEERFDRRREQGDL